MSQSGGSAFTTLRERVREELAAASATFRTLADFVVGERRERPWRVLWDAIFFGPVLFFGGKGTLV